MKNNNSLKMAGYTVALALALATKALANSGPGTVVQNFSFLTPATSAGPAALPSINGTWTLAQYAGLPADLQCVTLALTTRLVYDGTLVSLGASQAYSVSVRSDFNVDFGAANPGTVAGLDPVVLLSGTSPATPEELFNRADTQTQNQTTTLTNPGDLAAYLGGGTLPVFVTGQVLTTALNGTYNNISSLGPDSPGTFVNNPKVFPSYGLQSYQLETTLTVTYFVPEAGVSGVALLGLAAAWGWQRRQRR